MADCGKTEAFLAEVYRMGMSCEGEYKGGCEHCTISPVCNITIFSNKEWREKVISCVQEWSDEHPAPKQKTYADVFFEMHKQAMKGCDGAPFCCREVIFGTRTTREPCTKQNGCSQCWNEPYEEE